MIPEPMAATRPETPDYGIDADRLGRREPVAEALARRWRGQYSVDELGGDPHLQDLVLRPLAERLRVEVRGAERLPGVGPALLVANRGPMLVEPLVLVAAVQRATRRRLRVAGVPPLPLVDGLTHKLGGMGLRGGDVAAVLRAGHLVAAPLALSWWGVGAGEAPHRVIAATLGFPLVPVAVRPGGPVGLPLRPWVVTVGGLLVPPPGTSPGDPLAAAELAEQVRTAVAELLAR